MVDSISGLKNELLSSKEAKGTSFHMYVNAFDIHMEDGIIKVVENDEDPTLFSVFFQSKFTRGMISKLTDVPGKEVTSWVENFLSNK